MNWDNLPLELKDIIYRIRKQFMYSNKSSIKIQSIWRCYKTRVLIGRFRMLRYLKDFRIYNPNINEFIVKSKL